MEKKRVSVQIEGRSYSLITTDDEKYVQKVANEVLSHIRKAAQSTKQLDTRDCAVLAALNFCDDRNKALKKNKDYVEKADKIIQQTNDLNRLCKEYREKLTEAMNDNTRLINNNKELEKVTLVGLCTDICIISNALLIKANLPEVEIEVLENCCAGVTPESHINALNAMKMCQISVK